MSVSFQGVDGSYTLDLPNGTASDLLRAIGYRVGESTDGEMPIEKAVEGIAKAKDTLTGDHLRLLVDLEDLVGELEASGATQLTWW